jgi:uncharacterized 2Fe-2S/4Fe-4S cluster protein (DUF4445 family)
MSPTVRILPDDLSFAAVEGDVLADVLDRAGVALSLYCGRRGLCGKCLVEIVRGPLPAPGEDERAFLARRGLPLNCRLSCRYRISADLDVQVPEFSRLPRMPVLSRGVERSYPLEPDIRKIRLDVPQPALESPVALLDLVRAKFPQVKGRAFAAEGNLRAEPGAPAAVDLGASPDALRALIRAWEGGGPGSVLTAVLFADRELLTAEPGDTADQAFGIAVDLGTTTLVAELVDLTSGTVIDTAAALNPQVKFGSDVVSRISAAFGAPARAAELRDVVIAGLNEMIGGLCERNGVPRERVYEAVVAGNTAMNHLFLGLPVGTLAVAPYFAAFSVLPPVPVPATGLALNPAGRVIVAPNIKSFVGGDISAGLAAIDAGSHPGNFLFIDLGTNGEIVLKKGPRFTATSTAAGPAFEGMTISCGMLALPGAVYKAEDRDGGTAVETIGGLPARGVCGTGLIDLIAAALRQGRLSPQGHIGDPSQRIPVDGSVELTQKDIREVQLASAAVKTGIRMLLEANGTSAQELDAIYVAGAFGNYLNIPNAMALGLLPRVPEEKIRFIGNSSLAGARAMLLSAAERERCEALVGRIDHESLARGAAFQALFVEALEFKEWS